MDIENGILSSYSNRMTIDSETFRILEAIQTIEYIHSLPSYRSMSSNIGCFIAVEIIDFKCNVEIRNHNVIISDFFVKFQYQDMANLNRYFEIIAEEFPFSKEAKIEYQNGIPLELFEI